MTRTLLAILLMTCAAAQDPPAWQTAAGGKLAFEVASIRRAEPGSFKIPNVPLNAGDWYTPTGGRFIGTTSLSNFVQFAYKITLTRDQKQAFVDGLPGWVTTDSFAIEARAPASLPNPTKDQMRLMMQSLLADRFRLKVHFETRQVSMLALTLAKPGQLGLKLHPHQGPSCLPPPEASPTSPAGGEGIFATLPCDAYVMTANDAHTHILTGSNDTTMAFFAATMPNLMIPGQGSVLGAQEMPVVDRTGLSGRYDVVIEFSDSGSGPFPAFQVNPDPAGPSFTDALREQLGLKLEPFKGPLQILVIDHVEPPSEN